MSQINLLQPENFSPDELDQPKKRKTLFIVLVIGVLAVLTTYVIMANSQESAPESNYGGITLQPKKLGLFQIVKNFIFPPDAPLIGEGDNRINILLLGMGGAGHDGPYLTDTNIILSVKPGGKEAALISIPRDLSVKINGYGYRRINYANSYGEMKNRGQGGDFARKIFEQTFDLDIPYYVRVDFQAFKEIIDAVGGVNINAPNTFTDYSYPGPNDSYQTVSFTAGEQQMNGDRALIYARSRHGNNREGSDFARARRQQQVLEALKEKVLSAGTYLNPIRVKRILDSLNNRMNTNLEINQMMSLARLMKDVDGNIRTLVVDAGASEFLVPSRATNAYLLVPRTGNFNQINNAIDNIFNSTSTPNGLTAAAETPAFPKANIAILNGTWRVGLAARVKEELEQEGFYITSIGNSFRRPIEQTAIYLLTNSVPTDLINALKERIGGLIASDLPEWLRPGADDPATTEDESTLAKYKEGTEVLVILGNDAQD